MTDRGVLDMPVSRFWFMSSQLPRIMAETDLRSQTLTASMGSGDAVKEYRQHLIDQMGPVITEAPKFDPVGWAKLKALAG